MQKKKSDKKKTGSSVPRLTTLGLLTAAALMLFVLESALPPLVPIPGIKPGLANIITLIVLQRYGIREAFPVLLCRILLSSFFYSQAISLAYSLAGGLLCLLTMWGIGSLLHNKYLYLTSIFGALSHNLGQLLAALLLTGSPAVLAYLPFLMVGGAVTGLFTGLCAHYALKYLPKFPL